MNERIRELLVEVGLKVNYWKTNPPTPMQILAEYEQVEKFAELIVKECIEIVQPEPYDGDAMTASLNVKVKQIKQHFGVK